MATKVVRIAYVMLCPRCGGRFSIPMGREMSEACPVCGHHPLEHAPADQVSLKANPTSGGLIVSSTIGASVLGSAIGGIPGAAVGGVLGFILGLSASKK